MILDDGPVIVFGPRRQWGISYEDECLMFHPQLTREPQKTSPWIWREAFEEVERRGGFEAVKNLLVAEIVRMNDDGSAEPEPCVASSAWEVVA